MIEEVKAAVEAKVEVRVVVEAVAGVEVEARKKKRRKIGNRNRRTNVEKESVMNERIRKMKTPRI